MNERGPDTPPPPPPPPTVATAEDGAPKPKRWKRAMPLWAVILIAILGIGLGAASASSDEADVAAGDDVEEPEGQLAEPDKELDDRDDPEARIRDTLRSWRPRRTTPFCALELVPNSRRAGGKWRLTRGFDMQVHLVDGTYELFRYFYSPNNRDPEFGAVRGVLNSVLQLVDDGATHLGVATDQVIESFRNEMWPDYKDGSGVDPGLLAQFPIVEEALEVFGFAVWPQVTFEADDALAAGAALAAGDDRVERVIICTPDKDMAQLVGDRVVQWDRRQDKWYDTDGVQEKFGIPPESIPDYLGLVGDTADGFPGLPGWGAKSTATVLARYGHIEDIPPAAGQWDITVRGGAKLAVTLQENLDDALLFRTLATLQPDAPVSDGVDAMAWRGPSEEVADYADTIGAGDLAARAERLANR